VAVRAEAGKIVLVACRNNAAVLQLNSMDDGTALGVGLDFAIEDAFELHIPSLRVYIVVHGYGTGLQVCGAPSLRVYNAVNCHACDPMACLSDVLALLTG
jgi:hypothetical protein